MLLEDGSECNNAAMSGTNICAECADEAKRAHPELRPANRDQTPPEQMSIAELKKKAQVLGLSYRDVKNMRRDGLLAAIKGKVVELAESDILDVPNAEIDMDDDGDDG